MDLDDLKTKYRAIPLMTRLAMMLILGLAPGACSYFDEIETIEAGFSEAQAREDAARIKFESDRIKKANIPKLEEELVFTEGQLEKASKTLPEGYLMENILALTASNARFAGVNLTGFKPSCELQAQADFKYVEREIAVSVTGKFQQIAGFFDKMVHSDVMLFLREIVIEPTTEVANRADSNNTNSTESLSAFQLAEQSRRNLVLTASLKVVVFRAMKDEETSFFERKENCETINDSQEESTPVTSSESVPPTDSSVQPPAG